MSHVWLVELEEGAEAGYRKALWYPMGAWQYTRLEARIEMKRLKGKHPYFRYRTVKYVKEER